MPTYIPDHIRLQRSDRLYHIRESLLLTARRFLPDIWDNRRSYEIVSKCHHEAQLIDLELHTRRMRVPKPKRAEWSARFLEKGR